MNDSASSHTWVDNTSRVWEKLLAVLEQQDPKSIVVNVHPDIAFSGGLHAGELQKITAELGPRWAGRFVVRPMVAVEFIATMPKAQLTWYRKLQETVWALVSEAFSERVISPGETSTEVLQ